MANRRYVAPMIFRYLGVLLLIVGLLGRSAIAHLRTIYGIQLWFLRCLDSYLPTIAWAALGIPPPLLVLSRVSINSSGYGGGRLFRNW